MAQSRNGYFEAATEYLSVSHLYIYLSESYCFYLHVYKNHTVRSTGKEGGHWNKMHTKKAKQTNKKTPQTFYTKCTNKKVTKYKKAGVNVLVTRPTSSSS